MKAANGGTDAELFCRHNFFRRFVWLSVCCSLVGAIPLPSAAASSGETIPQRDATADTYTPTHSPWPGGIAVLNLGITGDEISQPRVFLAGKRVLVRRQQGHWIGLIGIPLSARPGSLALLLNDRPTSFHIEPRQYGESRIVIDDPRYTEPPDAALQQRIDSERTLIRAARAQWYEHQPDLSFRLPAQGQSSTAYGFRRYINDRLRSSHRGLDIAANEGTAVVAASAGRVILARDLFYTGLTLILDHGMGVQTLYAHLSEIDVAEGVRVEAGERIGAVGATGRVTGAHLHWGLTLNGITVDPGLLLSDSDRAAIGLLPVLRQ